MVLPGLFSYLFFSKSDTWRWRKNKSGPGDIKLFSCSAQLIMKFVLLINRKIITIANCFLLNIAEHENFSANKYENANNCIVGIFFYLLAQKFHDQLT